MARTKLAHSRNPFGLEESVIEHLLRVAALAREFAASWGGGDEAYAAGLLHDLGKYGDFFQQRIQGMSIRVDHSTPGAYAAMARYRDAGLSVALAVQGHHGGLLSADANTLLQSLDMRAGKIGGRTIAGTNWEQLLEELAQDGGVLPAQIPAGVLTSRKRQFREAEMLDHRMLFSALVDADSIATEGHFRTDARGYRVRSQGAPLEPERALELLLAHVKGLQGNSDESASDKSKSIQGVRDDLLQACLAAAEHPLGLFTLTAPTGAGKTLAMMAFALRHALLHGLRRVIVILPFLNIIDQTARVYERVFQEMGEEYVWQDHSLARESGKAGEREESSMPIAPAEVEEADDKEDPLRGATQNWDQPIVISTTVRFFESLFSNRRSDCYKLHNIAGSVILFDEAQTMPVHLAAPTLAALAHLQERYGCSVVFSTATQPALEHLFAEVEKVKPRTMSGWHPREIVPAALDLADRARRVNVAWPRAREKMTWEEVASAMVQEKQALTIVNLRRHARHLFELLRTWNVAGIFHLSTDMCPQHRLDLLDEVKRRLAAGEECRLVSTQCVEAGVDIDFPRVWRALAPLDSLAQAAGRCNREGKLGEGGIVTVFEPEALEGERTQFPSDDYEMAASVVKTMLVARTGGHLDLLDGETIQEYFTRYYKHAETEKQELHDGLMVRDFVRVAQEYEWITGVGVSVLVPYAGAIDEFRALVAQAEERRLNRDWWRRARLLAVQVRNPRRESVMERCVEVRAKGQASEQPTGWFYLSDPNGYDESLGLLSKIDWTLRNVY